MAVNDTLLKEILDCLDEDGSIQNVEEWKRYNSLLNLIIDETNIEGEQFRASENTIFSEIKDILAELKGEENLEEKFEENLEDLKEKLGKKDFNNYTIRFPLNIEFASVQKPEKMEARDFSVNSISKSDFKSKLSEIEDQKLEEFLEETSNDIFGKEFSYWEAEIRALDKIYAIEKLESQLEVLLGKINYSTFYNSWTTRYDRGIWPTRDHQLRNPFVYLLFKDGAYQEMFYDEDVSPRKKFRLTSTKAKKFEEIFMEMESLGPSNEDKRLEKGLRSFQKGATEYRLSESFLHYWRGIEILTLTNDGDSSKKAIDRARAIAGGFYERLDVTAEKIADKRNNLVHEGVDVKVYNSDVQYLQDLLESLLAFYLFDSFSIEDRKKLLKFSNMDEDDLKTHKADLERRVELAEEISSRKYSNQSNN